MLNLLLFPFRFLRWLWFLFYKPLSWVFSTVSYVLLVPLMYLSKAWIAIPLLLFFGWLAFRLDPVFHGMPPDRPNSSYVGYSQGQDAPLMLLLTTTVQAKEMWYPEHRRDQRIVAVALMVFFALIKILHYRIVDGTQGAERRKREAAAMPMPLLWKSSPASVKPTKLDEQREHLKSQKEQPAPPPKPPKAPKVINVLKSAVVREPKPLPPAEVSVACKDVATPRDEATITKALPEELQRLIGFSR